MHPFRWMALGAGIVSACRWASPHLYNGWWRLRLWFMLRKSGMRRMKATVAQPIQMRETPNVWVSATSQIGEQMRRDMVAPIQLQSKYMPKGLEIAPDGLPTINGQLIPDTHSGRTALDYFMRAWADNQANDRVPVVPEVVVTKC